MLLTEKAKEDFIQWSRKEYDKDLFCAFTSMPETSQNALIIEWLDTIQYKGQRLYSSFFTHTLNHRLPHCGFKEVSEKAIQLCNEFYNSLELNQLP